MNTQRTFILLTCLTASLSSSFLFLNATSPTTGKSCTSPEELTVGKSYPKDGLYVVSSPIKLCPEKVYTRGFWINNHGVTINCQGALLDGKPINGQASTGTAFTVMGFNDVTIKKCVVVNYGSALMATSHLGRSAKNPKTGEMLYFDKYSGSANSLYNPADKDPSYPPLNNFKLLKSKFYNNKGGALLRVKNSIVDEVIISGSALGLYLEADSFNNIIQNSTFSNSTVREGIVIDGAYNNQILNNVVENNASHGIVLYKNCGEYEDLWKRLNGANGNIIKGNRITGHKGRIDQLLAIQERAGIAIGLRQGLTMFNPGTLNKFISCSDPRSHMYKWFRLDKQKFEAVKAGHEKIRANDYVLGNKEYIGPHWDFADNNIIEGNILYNNSIAVYVSTPGNTVKGNRFFKWYSEPQYNQKDIFFGNTITDRIKKPILGLTLTDNIFHWAKKPEYLATSSLSKDSIKGTSVEVGVFKISDQVEALSILEGHHDTRKQNIPLIESYIER